ncbi:Uncharacterized protein APZ42_029872 [Daphnia magna]|uniref:Uncharacterized protein n=1 Tax=Daphnia magna TaxID=35525 RepID=A0A164P9E7_9CRUS|nr:Uncharacterized protein APZ42_029872 [Daphnia magna]
MQTTGKRNANSGLIVDATDMTDEIWKEELLTPLISQTTMEAFRLTISSIIGIVVDLLGDNYTFVLTGKLNQD